MRFEALGPLSVVTDEGRVHLRPAQRRLLASMLLDAATEIGTDKLIDRMWADAAPPTARNTLHSHMSSLRQRLPGIIESGSDWYRLELNGHEFDVPDFAHLAAEAAELLGAGEVHRAQCGAEETLVMWRGDPYPELIDVDAARGERARLTELYLSAAATLGQALKLQGRLPESISFLQRLVAEHPLNEVFWEHLVHGLYLAGRQADALTAYRDARDLLGKELGVEPGPRLQEMEGKILIHHPGLGTRPTSTPLAKLPDYRTSFVGRDDDLSGVVDLLAKHPLVSITGGPG
ncbi:MAG: AfsR/SARP family transcriptional regulator, partial [Acidimicrobiia bacterium]